MLITYRSLIRLLLLSLSLFIVIAWMDMDIFVGMLDSASSWLDFRPNLHTIQG